MLKTTTPPTRTPDGEQLLLGLLAALKMLLVSLALVVVMVALFTKSILSVAVVALTALGLLLTISINFVAEAQEVREFAAYLAATR